MKNKYILKRKWRRKKEEKKTKNFFRSAIYRQ